MNRSILKTVSTINDLNVEKLQSMNLGVEIQDFTEPNLLEEEKLEIIKLYKKELQNFNGIKALHGPFLDLKPASPDNKIRKVSYKRYLETLEIAEKLNMDYIILHSQINPKLNEPSLRKLNSKQHRDAWVKLLEEMPNYKGTILLENVFEEEPSMLKELIQTIKLPNINVNLDIGHAKLGKVSLEKWIKELKDYIVYMHIHSNDGLYDLHTPPNKEEIKNLYNLIDKYNINPVLSLEYNIENLKQEMKKYRSEI